ncbi:unnamed protein product [Pedinophyceae sp. YPF-701]|nr:unnamed protein product [Pedinophyceae sp. YPF-701]
MAAVAWDDADAAPAQRDSAAGDTKEEHDEARSVVDTLGITAEQAWAKLEHVVRPRHRRERWLPGMPHHFNNSQYVPNFAKPRGKKVEKDLEVAVLRQECEPRDAAHLEGSALLRSVCAMRLPPSVEYAAAQYREAQTKKEEEGKSSRPLSAAEPHRESAGSRSGSIVKRFPADGKRGSLPEDDGFDVGVLTDSKRHSAAHRNVPHLGPRRQRLHSKLEKPRDEAREADPEEAMLRLKRTAAVQRNIGGLLSSHRLQQGVNDKDQMHCHNLFWYLWAPSPKTGKSFHSARIPHTVYIHNHQPVAWFFTAKNGEVKRKTAEKVNDRGTILDALLTRRRRDVGRKGNVVAAQYIPHNFKGVGSDLFQLDPQNAQMFLLQRQLEDGIIQEFVPSSDEYTVLLTAEWAPTSFLLSRYHVQNKLSNISKLLCEVGQLEPSSAQAVGNIDSGTGQVTNQKVKGICDAVAAHVHDVSPQAYVVNRMKLNFAVDSMGRLWLLYCSQIAAVPGQAFAHIQRAKTDELFDMTEPDPEDLLRPAWMLAARPPRSVSPLYAGARAAANARRRQEEARTYQKLVSGGAKPRPATAGILRSANKPNTSPGQQRAAPNSAATSLYGLDGTAPPGERPLSGVSWAPSGTTAGGSRPQTAGHMGGRATPDKPAGGGPRGVKFAPPEEPAKPPSSGRQTPAWDDWGEEALPEDAERPGSSQHRRIAMPAGLALKVVQVARRSRDSAAPRDSGSDSGDGAPGAELSFAPQREDSGRDSVADGAENGGGRGRGARAFRGAVGATRLGARMRGGGMRAKSANPEELQQAAEEAERRRPGSGSGWGRPGSAATAAARWAARGRGGVGSGGGELGNAQSLPPGITPGGMLLPGLIAEEGMDSLDGDEKSVASAVSGSGRGGVAGSEEGGPRKVRPPSAPPGSNSKPTPFCTCNTCLEERGALIKDTR